MQANTKRLLQAIGILLTDRRLSANQSQEDLGEKIGLSRDGLANVEYGRQMVFIDQMIAISEALNVNLAKLLPTDEIFTNDDAREIRTLMEVVQPDAYGIYLRFLFLPADKKPAVFPDLYLDSGEGKTQKLKAKNPRPRKARRRSSK